MATERHTMPNKKGPAEELENESTSLIFRRITAADRALLDDIKLAASIRTDSKAVVHVLRDYKAERERCDVAQRDAHNLRLLVARAAKAVQAHRQTADALSEVQNELLGYIAGL